MKDYFLKFDSEAKAKAELLAVGWSMKDEEGKDVIPSSLDNGSIDQVGMLSTPTGKYLTGGDGEQYPEYQAVEGWHVNVRLSEGELPEALLPFCIHPLTPMRVFA